MVRLRRSLTKLARRKAPVSIPLWCDCDEVLWKISTHVIEFQSHYGAIATTEEETRTYLSSLFQSHYGAIATRMGCPALHNFSAFQSHYGAIATNRTINIICDAYKRFQSHYGAIATYVHRALARTADSFNPTMVRLRPRRY